MFLQVQLNNFLLFKKRKISKIVFFLSSKTDKCQNGKSKMEVPLKCGPLPLFSFPDSCFMPRNGTSLREIFIK